ncbi:hypothetical protein BSKO_03387 [Bryopsis sp. KO-2023]|nr:hypothetical protein BSKO_03387 [Bryopsis sp. KO-2023]
MEGNPNPRREEAEFSPPKEYVSLEIQERAPQQFVKSKLSAGPSTHELRKWTTFKDRGTDFWSSLPASSRIFLLLSLLDAVLIIVYAFWQFQWVRKHIFEISSDCSEDSGGACEEHQHVVLAMLVTALFFVVLVWDSIWHENDFELLSSMVLSAVMTGRVVYFLYTADKVKEYARITGLLLALVFETLTIVFAYMTYKKFGWRVYSKLACDLRLKNAEERRTLYFRFHRFRTLMKLDLQFLVLFGVTGLTMGIMLKDTAITCQGNMMLLFSTGSGCLVGFIWLSLAYLAVRRDKKSLGTFLEFTCLLTFTLPILTVVSVYISEDREVWEGKESLLVATLLYISTRVAVWVYMRRLLRVSKPEKKLSLGDTFKQHDTNPDLLPMFKGAWLYKPSPQSPNKKRFFQLSQDHTTLRWAWNKYVILYYADELLTDDLKKTITLVFSMEPDLVLGFKTMSEYEDWKRGFHLLLTMLMAPDPGIDRCSLNNRPGRSMMHIDYRNQSNNVLQKFLGGFGISTTSRWSITDQKKKRPKHRMSRKAELSRNVSGSGSMSMTPADSNTAPMHEGGLHPGGELVTVAPGHFRVVMPEHLSASSTDRNNNKLGKENSMSGQQQRDSGKNTFNNETSADLAGMPQKPSVIHGLGLQMPIEMIDHNDLEFGKFLGAGAEGAVWAAWYQETPVAVKKTDSMNELEIIVSANQHDNIVGFRGLAKDGSSTFLVLEYCPRGTLDGMLHHTRMTRWDLTKVLQMVRGVARGMLHLHTRKPAILHRDLKPGNIFIGHGLVLKIGDFGMSRHVANDPDQMEGRTKPPLKRQFTTGVIGTAAYSAPELIDERLQSHEYSKGQMLKADVYSFGVCLWEIAERERPFEGMTSYEIAAQWLSNPEDMKLPALSVPKDATTADLKILNECQNLVQQCTSIDANRRPDFKTILKRLKQVHNDINAGKVAGI